jgi:hypothetical protein
VDGVSADRPINADVSAPEDAPKPAVEPKKATTEKRGPEKPAPTRKPDPDREKTEAAAAPPPRRRRRGIPGPIKLVAALVAIAIGFIVLAVVAGGGGSKKAGESTATTASTTPVVPAEAPTSDEGESAEDPPEEEGGTESESGSAGGEELGYPSFATSNTTRVGGTDPAATAAASALTVFPATNDKQRPVAVSLVGEEDWAGAIAAAVLMAEPVKAPILYGEAEGVPEATASALGALRPGGGAASGGAAVFAVGDVQIPAGLSAAKIKAGDPAEEAAAIARLRDRLAGSPPDAIILASSSEPAFAAPAAAYAARSGDPVLYTEAESLPQATVSALRRDKGVPVYALGPGSAISGKVLKEVEALGDKVTRISGADPVAGAIAFARFGEGGFGWHVSDPGHGFVLVRADAPLEAAAAAPLSASGTWGPLLLTDSADTLPSELRGYFLDVKPGYTTDPTRAFYNHVWIVGDTGQISVEQQAEVNEVAELAKIGSKE